MNASNDIQKLFSAFMTPAEISANKQLALISATITLWREDHKMTQTSFAKLMNVTQAMVSKWESGEYNFTVKTLADISVKLGISLEQLFCGTPIFQSYSKPVCRTIRVVCMNSTPSFAPRYHSTPPSFLTLPAANNSADGGAA